MIDLVRCDYEKSCQHNRVGVIYGVTWKASICLHHLMSLKVSARHDGYGYWEEFLEANLMRYEASQ